MKQERKESPFKAVMLSLLALWATRLSHRATPELLCEADPRLSTWQPDRGAAVHRLLLAKGYPCHSRCAEHKCGVAEKPRRVRKVREIGCSSGKMPPGNDGCERGGLGGGEVGSNTIHHQISSYRKPSKKDMMENMHFACFLYHHHEVHTLQMKIQNHFRIGPVLFPKLLVSAQAPPRRPVLLA